MSINDCNINRYVEEIVFTGSSGTKYFYEGYTLTITDKRLQVTRIIGDINLEEALAIIRLKEDRELNRHNKQYARILDS